jgi:dihydroflavonol-4-reductase
VSRCAVTGANGFVGAHVVRELLERGHEVIALVGADQDTASLAGLPIELRDFDLRDASSVRAGLEGAERVVHAAAMYAFWAPDRRDIYRVNVRGTRHVLEAARELGVSKLVHTSSAATLSPGFEDGEEPLCEGSEDAAFDLRAFRGHYKMSKAMAEVLVLREAARGLPAVIVHPTTVMGPGDRRPTPSGSMIQHYVNGHMKAWVAMQQNVVDVRDVAAGIALALEKAPRGERYVLGGDNLSMRELLDLLDELTGIPAPRVRIPLPVLALAGSLGEWLADHVTHGMPTACREQAMHARDGRFVSSEKAKRELGYAPRGARAVLAAAVCFFASEGYCKSGVADRILRRPQLEEALRAGAAS